jgi:hypothetical protein
MTSVTYLKNYTWSQSWCKATWFRDSCPAWMAASAALTLTAAAVEPLLDVTWLLTPELGELDVPFAWLLPPELRWDTSVTCSKHVRRDISLIAYLSKVANKWYKIGHWYIILGYRLVTSSAIVTSGGEKGHMIRKYYSYNGLVNFIINVN